MSYLHPILDRENLTILTGQEVKELTFDDAGACTGVISFDKPFGRPAHIAARREVIVSTGAINTPQLLMLSGIGPADHLREIGIERIRDRDALLSAVAEAVVDDLTECLTSVAATTTPMANGQYTLETLANELRAFAHDHPEGFRLIFTASAPLDALDRAAQPVLTASAPLVGEADALKAARLFASWTTGFLQMELAGAFRLGGDVDDAFSYGLRVIIAGLRNRSP